VYIQPPVRQQFVHEFEHLRVVVDQQNRTAELWRRSHRYARGLGRDVALTDIRAPIFAVGTEQDHVAPWRSAYKVHLLTDTTVTFVLTAGGHNAGIVSEPGHPRRWYRVATQASDERYVDPDTWLQRAERREGSWWPEWVAWLASHSGDPIEPPPLGAAAAGYAPLADAPGSYVLQP